MNKETIMLKVLIVALSTLSGAGAAFAQGITNASEIEVPVQLAQMEARTIITERSDINHQAQLRARDHLVAQQAEEIAMLKRDKQELIELLDGAMDVIWHSDVTILQYDQRVAAHCLVAENDPLCKDQKNYLEENPEIYVIWIPSVKDVM